MSLRDATLLLYCFALDFTIKDTEKLVPHLSHSAIVAFYQKIRLHICPVAETIIMDGEVDGTVQIVEIDESLLGKKQKYHRGRRSQRQWVFGLVERNTNKTYFVPVQDRSKETLIPIIKRIVKHGSTIYHDDWAAYRELDTEGYQHDTVVHKREFVSKSGACTNTIEGNLSLSYQTKYSHEGKC